MVVRYFQKLHGINYCTKSLHALQVKTTHEEQHLKVKYAYNLKTVKIW